MGAPQYCVALEPESWFDETADVVAAAAAEVTVLEDGAAATTEATLLLEVVAMLEGATLLLLLEVVAMLELAGAMLLLEVIAMLELGGAAMLEGAILPLAVVAMLEGATVDEVGAAAEGTTCPLDLPWQGTAEAVPTASSKARYCEYILIEGVSKLNLKKSVV